MTRHERFARAMSHQPTPRPPFDLGGTSLTSMSEGCAAALADFLGFRGEPARRVHGIDERVLEWAGADFRSVGGIVGLPGPHARRVSDVEFIDCWGVRRTLRGAYWEITGAPLSGASAEDLKSYPWPEARVDEASLRRWEAEARELHAEGRYVVVAEHPVFGILELGCWMCGYGDFLLKLALDPDFVRAFFDIVFRIQMSVIEQYYPVLGPHVALTTSGDDFGTQTGPFLSPRMFRELIAPQFSARIARTKELGRCAFWHHTCGSVAALLDEIIACGVDILNPIQTSAAEMEPASLKARFGDRLVFWGGVDVQQFLPQATPSEVGAHVRELIRVLGHDGGYVMAPAHNMQDDIPPENIVAWVEAVRESGPECSSQSKSS